MYGNARSPGVRYRYRRLVCGDWWNEDPRSPTYNTFQHVRCGTRPPFRTTTPGLWQERTAYRHFAVIESSYRPACSIISSIAVAMPSARLSQML